jgi:orotate phosphoribosyltransferase
VTQAEWLEVYRGLDAYWLHDRNPKRPHALLSSGRHSNGFFNSGEVLQDPKLCQKIVFHLVRRLAETGLMIKTVDRVVGPAMGAITLAYELAKQITDNGGRPCLTAFTEKQGEGDEEKMVFKRVRPQPGEYILVTEDVITTGESIGRVIQAIQALNGVDAFVVPLVLTIVNRSGFMSAYGLPIIALVDQPMPRWPADECPLCREGSEAIPPKTDGNWARLNAEY